MSEYITRIRTEQGDKQIDYNFLANLPQSDETLTMPGKFADSKATGDKIKKIEDSVEEINDGIGKMIDNVVNTHITEIASNNKAGHMSASDKAKLDGIDDNANNYSLPKASNTNLGGVTTTSNISSTDGLTPCPIIDGVPYCKNIDTVATTSEMNLLSGLSTISEKPKTTTVTLTSSAWIDKCQTIPVAHVTPNNLVIVSPNPYPDNYDAYIDADIRCIAQFDGELVFSYKYEPEMDVAVNVVIFI